MVRFQFCAFPWDSVANEVVNRNILLYFSLIRKGPRHIIYVGSGLVAKGRKVVKKCGFFVLIVRSVAKHILVRAEQRADIRRSQRAV
jgi:hypothetical protein